MALTSPVHFAATPIFVVPAFHLWLEILAGRSAAGAVLKREFMTIL